MAVGSGSIKRVQKAAAQIQGDTPVTEEAIVVAEVKAEVNKEAPKKAPAKKAPAKKAAPKKTSATAAKKVEKVKKDDIHEKKFQVISKIKSDLPDYLL